MHSSVYENKKGTDTVRTPTCGFIKTNDCRNLGSTDGGLGYFFSVALYVNTACHARATDSIYYKGPCQVDSYSIDKQYFRSSSQKTIPVSAITISRWIRQTLFFSKEYFWV